MKIPMQKESTDVLTLISGLIWFLIPISLQVTTL